MIVGIDPIPFFVIGRLPFWEIIPLFSALGHPILPFNPEYFKQGGYLYFHIVRVPPLRPVPGTE
jgi:hypothetical protein